jgi:spore germination cell wall hydrolase CwlJ-like protein
MQVNLSLNKFLPGNFRRLRLLDLCLVLLASLTLITFNGFTAEENQTKEGKALSALVEKFSDEMKAVTVTMAKTFNIKEEVNPKTYDPFDVVTNLLPTLSKTQLKNKQVQCLAENIYYEARGQNGRGWLAVAEVTMNRVKRPGYPDTICGVVHQRTPVENNVVCQFSWTCETMNRPQGYLWELAQKFAAAFYFNPEEFPSVAAGATHYHATHVNPGWKLPVVAKIQDHIFYKKY